MNNANVTIGREALVEMRRRPCGFVPARALRWRKLFAEEGTHVKRYQVEDIACDLSLGINDDFVTALTGTEPITTFFKPGSKENRAWGGTGHRQETVAHALGLLHVLGAISPPWEVIEPLIARIKKKKMLTAEELHVLWGRQEANVPRLFTWPADSVDAFPDALEVTKTLHGNIVFAFKDPDGFGKELVTPVGWTRLKTTLEHLVDAGCVTVNRYLRRADIRALVDKAALPERRKPAERANLEQFQLTADRTLH